MAEEESSMQQLPLKPSRQIGGSSMGNVPTKPNSASRQTSTKASRKNSSAEKEERLDSTSKEGEQAITPSEADELAQILDRLQVTEAESTRSTSAEAPEGKTEDPEIHGLLETVKSRIRAGRTPKKALEPILEAFDLKGVANYIKAGKAKRIVVMSGAGISVSAGIPDFRSPGTGLYDNLQKFNLPHPQAVFELDFFRRDPQPFYLLAKELFPGRFKPTAAHYFLKLLDQKGLLLRAFTQNIDSLEREAGIPAQKIVAAHGNFDTAHCIDCHSEVPQATVRQSVDAGEICTCSSCGGFVKPDIVFFGENLPELFFHRAESDFPKADLLIVMGTSLVVHPFASLIGIAVREHHDDYADHVGAKVPRVLINRERVGEADAALSLLGFTKGFKFDSQHRDALYLGDCDEGARILAQHLGWADELEGLINAS